MKTFTSALVILFAVQAHAGLVDPNLTIGEALLNTKTISPGQPATNDIQKTQNSFGTFFQYNINFREYAEGGGYASCYFTFLDNNYTAKEIATFIVGADGKDFKRIKWIVDDPLFPNNPNYFKAATKIKSGVAFDVDNVNTYTSNNRKCVEGHYDYSNNYYICDKYGPVIGHTHTTYWNMPVAGQKRLGFVGSCTLATSDLNRSPMTLNELQNLTKNIFQFEAKD